MKTYQDLQQLGEDDSKRIEFVEKTIREHRGSELYKQAYCADLYYKQRNPTIEKYEKIIYDITGKATKDKFSPNHKVSSNWYFYFTVQGVQYLLGNGVTFGNRENKNKFGKNFDGQLQKLATAAKNAGVAFGFYNNGNVEVFDAKEFIPLYDEEDGALKAGVRYWQIEDGRPLRATLYELDGYTGLAQEKGQAMQIRDAKRPYKQIVVSTETLGEEIVDGGNYNGFPVVPLYNINRQSDLVGKRNTIDAYDLISSKFVNNVSEGDLIYWVIQNCDGMDDIDDIKFVEQLRTTHVAHTSGGDGAKVDAHSINAPFEASETVLARLEKQLYKDFMALNVEEIQAGNVTATQIEAAYEPLNQKTDLFEYCVLDFVHELMALAGVDDEVSFTRSRISNQSEITQTVLMAAEYLDDQTILSKLPWLAPEEVDEILKRKDAEDLSRSFVVTGKETEE